MKKILITSALPYVNNVPHLGNIIGCVLSADVFSRYCKSRGYNSVYVCGTDEYGTATEIKARQEGCTPQEICDKYYKIHKDIYEWFGIRFDVFGRTSTPKHTELTQGIFKKLHKNGYIIEEDVVQLYDEKAKMFLADRYIEGICPFCSYEQARADQCDKCGKLLHEGELIEPVSKISGTKPVPKKSRHLFLNLPGVEGALVEWIGRAAKEGHWSENSYNIAKAWLRDGLKKRAITRDLKWGVPVPLKGFEDKVFYVWFDAPIGYISITANFTKEWEKWWMSPKDVMLYQFMGKDNVPFHTVIFPATLLGTKDDWTLLHHISTTEYLNYEGGKFSKSRNVGVFGDDAMKSGIPSDVWRYYLLSNRPESSDSDFTWEDFRDKNNNELLANLGNLVNRATVFTRNNFDGKMPESKPDEKDGEFIAEQANARKEITELLEKVKIKEALHRIMAYVKNCNRYFQANKPWELVKSDKERAGTVLAILLREVKDIAIMAEPYLPATSRSMFSQLGMKPEKWDALGKELKAGRPLGKPEILFTKLEEKRIKELKQKFGGKQEPEGTRFSDLDLEVGEIVSVERHPDAEKLYIEKVKMGAREVQIVSGLVPYYAPEKLKGKKVIIVRNLMPAKLRGVESEGMLLVADTKGDLVEVIECPGCKPGDKVSKQGEKPKPKPHITIKEFAKVNFEVKEYTVLAEGKPLVAGGKKLKTKEVKKGEVC